VAVAVVVLSIAIGGASTQAKEEGQKAAPQSEGQKAAPSTTPTKTIKTSVSTIRPEPPSVLSRPSTTSPEESAALERGVQKMREQLDAANAKRYRGGGAEIDAAPVGTPTKVAAEPKSLLITKSRRNTVAQSVSQTLAEPAAATDNREVLYAGNTYQSRSTNSGATWVNAGKYPAGPADAPHVCCDPDAVHASNTDTTFHSILYTNIAETNGVVRIFVRDGNISGGVDPVDCVYDIDPAGTRDNIVPDYPHLATSNNFLYLSTHDVTKLKGRKWKTEWVGARTMRVPLQQIANCQSTTWNRYTYSYSGPGGGPRVHVPVENATTTMYWGQLDNATTFRIYSWPESQTSPSVVAQTVRSTTFANPNCKGGTGDFDWIEEKPSWSITGFRMRGATGGGTLQFLWNAAPDTEHPQAHIHGAVFRTSDLALIAEPSVFTNSFCFGYPALGANKRGEYGMSLAFGGDKTANSGTSARGGVGVDDASSEGFRFPTFTRIATGTHNPSDNRFGDYFTVRKNERCPNTWVATNYALYGGNTKAAHVNARYVEFQSSSAHRCPK
jgi:hypothetical protein